MVGVLDAGNTQIKCAVFDNQILVASEVFATNSDQDPQIFFSGYTLNKIIVSSVIHLRSDFLDKSKATIIEFTNRSIIPLKNMYRTPETLGLDRLANACGAYEYNQRKGPVLVVDMGTCVKFDLVDENLEYKGGSISPGLAMRFKALHDYTAKLPLLSSVESPKLLGTSTQESICSGVQNGLLAEVDGFITAYKQQYPGIKVFLTGGDSAFFSGSLKNNIFAVPLLTLYGLNAIAQLNEPNE